jgi:hypothetical protein
MRSNPPDESSMPRSVPLRPMKYKIQPVMSPQRSLSSRTVAAKPQHGTKFESYFPKTVFWTAQERSRTNGNF